MQINYSKLRVTWKNNLNNIYKENTIIGVGQEAVINFSSESISNIYVNFEVDGEVYTDLVQIERNIIHVPFKTDVLKKGTHKLEIVAYLKNGDVVPSPTFSYYVEDAIENPNDITAETNYPILIQLLEEVEEWNEDAKRKEIERQENENTRISNENTRISNENTRKSNESNRQQYETQRRAEEDERLTDEQVRVNAENIRIANENERLRKEIERQNAEELRQIAYNSSLYTRMDETEDRLNEVDSQLAHNENYLKEVNLKSSKALTDLLPTYPHAEILFEIDDTNNFQSIESFGGYIYCGFELDDGMGKINKYDRTGKLIDTTGSLNFGHTDSLSYRRSNSRLYVGAGGYNPFFVREFDWNTKTITREINLVSLGSSGLFTVDNDRDLFIVHTSGGDVAPHNFRIFDFDIKQIKHFVLDNIGTPQNIYYYNDIIYFYTNNKVTCIDLDGNIVKQSVINNTAESESMCIDLINGRPALLLGWNSPNRIYKINNAEYNSNISLQVLGSANPRSNTAIVVNAKILAFSIKNINGVWTINNYQNGFANDNLFESITQTTNAVKITLKNALRSCEYVGTQIDLNLGLADITSVGVINSDMKTFDVQFFRQGERQDPANLTNYSVIKMLICCSI